MKIWWQLLTYVHHYHIHMYLIHFITGDTALWLDALLQHHTCTRCKLCLLHSINLSIYQTTLSSSPLSSSLPFSPSSFNPISSLPFINHNPIYTSVSKQYRKTVNFRVRKISWISKFCGYLWKFGGHNVFWWHKQPICKSFLHENLLPPVHKSFLFMVSHTTDYWASEPLPLPLPS